MIEVGNDSRCWDFLARPGLRLCLPLQGHGISTPHQGAKVLYAAGCSQELNKIMTNGSKTNKKNDIEMGRAVERAGFGQGLSGCSFGSVDYENIE